MKRPTRVPASSVVRMKSASNMMAKWYRGRAPCRRGAREDARHPTARLGAPPVRAKSVRSPISRASASISPGQIGKPQLEMVAVATAGSVPTTPPGC